MNQLKLTDALQKELWDIRHAEVLADGKLLVFCKNSEQRAKATKMQSLGGRLMEAFASGKKGGPKGVIYGVSLDISMEDLVRGINRAKVTEAIRFKTGPSGEKRDSSTVLLNFKDEKLPEQVFLGYLCFQMRVYVAPPRRCYKCQNYGYIAAVCRSKRRCGNCGGDHVLSECKESEPKCGNCGGTHIAGYRGCEQYARAVKVQQIKEGSGVSYAEAVRRMDVVGEGQTMGAGIVPKTVPIPDDCVLIKKMEFLGFMVESEEPGKEPVRCGEGGG